MIDAVWRTVAPVSTHTPVLAVKYELKDTNMQRWAGSVCSDMEDLQRLDTVSSLGILIVSMRVSLSAARSVFCLLHT